VEAESGAIFDLDIHDMSARKTDPAHVRYDVRFVIKALDEAFSVSKESLGLAWVPLTELHRYTDEESVLRMARKWKPLCYQQ
jgi:hypothetical protein